MAAEFEFRSVLLHRALLSQLGEAGTSDLQRVHRLDVAPHTWAQCLAKRFGRTSVDRWSLNAIAGRPVGLRH
jgi:hypothetical protein